MDSTPLEIPEGSTNVVICSTFEQPDAFLSTLACRIDQARSTMNPDETDFADPTEAAGLEESGAPYWDLPRAYERFMGRWSRRVANRFLPALGVAPRRRWLDVGCGTGVLTRAIVERCMPAAVTGVDPSPAFLSYAAEMVPPGVSVEFRQGHGEALPFPPAVFDATVSGLTLNFTADQQRALQEMVRVTRPRGVVAAYVWKYDHPDFFLSRFWEAVARSGGDSTSEDERVRWPVCAPDGLHSLAERFLRGSRIWEIEIATVFPSTNVLWDGFLLGVGPAGAWTARLDPDQRARLRAQFEAALPAGPGGTVPLVARALAVAGTA
jgi:SAM-dependent methyltransferase